MVCLLFSLHSMTRTKKTRFTMENTKLMNEKWLKMPFFHMSVVFQFFHSFCVDHTVCCGLKHIHKFEYNVCFRRQSYTKMEMLNCSSLANAPIKKPKKITNSVRWKVVIIYSCVVISVLFFYPHFRLLYVVLNKNAVCNNLTQSSTIHGTFSMVWMCVLRINLLVLKSRVAKNEK